MSVRNTVGNVNVWRSSFPYSILQCVCVYVCRTAGAAAAASSATSDDEESKKGKDDEPKKRRGKVVMILLHLVLLNQSPQALTRACPSRVRGRQRTSKGSNNLVKKLKMYQTPMTTPFHGVPLTFSS